MQFVNEATAQDWINFISACAFGSYPQAVGREDWESMWRTRMDAAVRSVADRPLKEEGQQAIRFYDERFSGSLT